MSCRRDWVWGDLTPAQLAIAEAVAARMEREVKARKLPQPRYANTPDEWKQKLTGAEGEIAFRVLTGRPIPSVDAIVSTWKRPDVDGLAVKTVSKPDYRLVFDDSDLAGAEGLVLMLNAKPRFAIIGWISVAGALECCRWGVELPRPTWLVEQRALRAWQE